MAEPTDSPESTRLHHGDTPAGFAYGLAAYGLWGVIPLYFKLLVDVDPREVLAHRAFWSFLVLLTAIAVRKLFAEVASVVRDRRALITLVGSALLIGTNWFVYIYAVSTEQIVQAGLGYFITPLANVLLGVTLLRERLRGMQVLALIAATVGVTILTVKTGEVPWIALSLATSFSLYGLLRKLVRAEALVGLFIETTILSPLALAYIAYLQSRGLGSFTIDNPRTTLYLVLSGTITTIPLVCFAAAARRLRMTTLGFLQFLAPSLQLAIAVFLFGEPFTKAHAEAFPLIWIAVGLYLADAVLTRRRSL